MATFTFLILVQNLKKKYNHSITTILKQLKLSGKFLDFLKNSSCFNIKKVGKRYQVAIANN